jgi:hypothetical protein
VIEEEGRRAWVYRRGVCSSDAAEVVVFGRRDDAWRVQWASGRSRVWLSFEEWEMRDDQARARRELASLHRDAARAAAADLLESLGNAARLEELAAGST